MLHSCLERFLCRIGLCSGRRGLPASRTWLGFSAVPPLNGGGRFGFLAIMAQALGGGILRGLRIRQLAVRLDTEVSE